MTEIYKRFTSVQGLTLKETLKNQKRNKMKKFLHSLYYLNFDWILRFENIILPNLKLNSPFADDGHVKIIPTDFYKRKVL